MLDALLSLIPGGSLTAIGALIVFALGAVIGIFRSGKKAGRNEERAKDADSFEKELSRVEKAASARADAERRARAGELHDEHTRDD